MVTQHAGESCKAPDGLHAAARSQAFSMEPPDKLLIMNFVILRCDTPEPRLRCFVIAGKGV